MRIKVSVLNITVGMDLALLVIRVILVRITHATPEHKTLAQGL